MKTPYTLAELLILRPKVQVLQQKRGRMLKLTSLQAHVLVPSWAHPYALKVRLPSPPVSYASHLVSTMFNPMRTPRWIWTMMKRRENIHPQKLQSSTQHRPKTTIRTRKTCEIHDCVL
jgi:hypothetical protein